MPRPKGSKNRPKEQRVAELELRARMKLAKAGVVVSALVPPPDYTATIKPGERDLTDRFARLQEAIDMYRSLQQIKYERSIHPLLQDVPGGMSGLVTFTWVRNGPESYGKASRTDTGLDAAILGWLVYISKELGQYLPDQPVRAPGDKVVQQGPPDYSVLSTDDFEHLRRIGGLLEAARQGKKVVDSVVVEGAKESG